MKIAFLRHDMQSHHALLHSCSTHLCNRCSLIRFKFTLRNGVNLILLSLNLLNLHDLFPDKSRNAGYNAGHNTGYSGYPGNAFFH